MPLKRNQIKRRRKKIVGAHETHIHTDNKSQNSHPHTYGNNNNNNNNDGQCCHSCDCDGYGDGLLLNFHIVKCIIPLSF